MVVALADRRCWLYNIVSTLAQSYTNVINLQHKSAFLVNILSALAQHNDLDVLFLLAS